VSAIVAAREDAVRTDLAGRTVAAGFTVDALAADPRTLSGTLAPLPRAWVVTGGTARSAEPFIRTALAADVPVLAVVSGEQRAHLPRVMRHCASAVLDPSRGIHVFQSAVAAMQAGLAAWEPEAAIPAGDEYDREVRLSGRELEVLGLVAQGLSTKAVARQLGLSPNTVKCHVQAAFEKLGATSRAEAVMAAIRRGELAV
jgi:DNA-binding NarL/FixJ family response regulator